MADEAPEFRISPTQGVQLMALSNMPRDGELSFRGYEQDDEKAASALLADIAQEIALQVPTDV